MFQLMVKPINKINRVSASSLQKKLKLKFYIYLYEFFNCLYINTVK